MAKKMTALEEFKKAKEEYLTKMKDGGERLVTELLKDFFSAFPEIKTVRWTQYTPYFNDGDACVFSVGEPDVEFHEDKLPETLKEEVESDGFIYSWSLSYNKEFKETALNKGLEKLASELQSLEDVLEIAFGDHAQVSATATKVTVDAYEHD